MFLHIFGFNFFLPSVYIKNYCKTLPAKYYIVRRERARFVVFEQSLLNLYVCVHTVQNSFKFFFIAGKRWTTAAVPARRFQRSQGYNCVSSQGEREAKDIDTFLDPCFDCPADWRRGSTTQKPSWCRCRSGRSLQFLSGNDRWQGAACTRRCCRSCESGSGKWRSWWSRACRCWCYLGFPTPRTFLSAT